MVGGNLNEIKSLVPLDSHLDGRVLWKVLTNAEDTNHSHLLTVLLKHFMPLEFFNTS